MYVIVNNYNHNENYSRTILKEIKSLNTNQILPKRYRTERSLLVFQTFAKNMQFAVQL